MREQLQTRIHAVEVPSAVRPEYLNLPRDLDELARGFNIRLSSGCQRDATTLVLAIECVDRIFDSLPNANARAQFATNVLAVLEDNSLVTGESFPAEVRERLFDLHEVIQRRNVTAHFCVIIRRILWNSEKMRSTRLSSFYVHAAVAEGRWMVELLLLILGDAVSHQFGEFMRRVAGPANLGDKLRDARSDFILGELAIKPGLLLHLRLACGMFWRVLALALRFCGYGKILLWGLKSLYYELAWARRRAA